jgi:hypothetical protein
MGIIARLGDPDRHFWLVRSVARVMDLDLGGALARGELHRDDYRAFINVCRTCPLVEACQNWLATSTGPSETPPAGCLISADLNRLKRQTPSKGTH